MMMMMMMMMITSAIIVYIFSQAALTCRYKTIVIPYTPSIGNGTYTTSTGTAPAHLHYMHQIN